MLVSTVYGVIYSCQHFVVVCTAQVGRGGQSLQRQYACPWSSTVSCSWTQRHGISREQHCRDLSAPASQSSPRAVSGWWTNHGVQWLRQRGGVCFSIPRAKGMRLMQPCLTITPPGFAGCGGECRKHIIIYKHMECASVESALLFALQAAPSSCLTAAWPSASHAVSLLQPHIRL